LPLQQRIVRQIQGILSNWSTSMLWITGLIVAIGVMAVAALGLSAYGNARWAKATRTLLDRLEVARLPPPTRHHNARELEGLPAPVRRHFRAMFKDGQHIVTLPGWNTRAPSI
jgi:hypothetical protein